jgi:hypothetical protein
MENMPSEGKMLIWAYEQAKPMIEKGLYDLAYSSIYPANLVLRSSPDALVKILKDVHCGSMFLGSARTLEDALKSKDKDRIKDAQEKFEAYTAQTRLLK